MKRKQEVIVKKQEIVEDPNGGLVSLLKKEVYLICASYIYAGTLVGVNSDCVELENAVLVYETGPWFQKSGWKDAQKLPGSRFGVQKSMIEAWGENVRG